MAMAELKLDSPLQFIKGVGPRKAEVLASHGMTTVRDLLFYFPRGYLDRTTILPIKDLRVDEIATFIGKVRAHGQLYGGKRRRYEAILGDETGDIQLVFFDGAQYWKNFFKKNMILAATGRVSYYHGKQLIHPDLERLEDDSDKLIHSGRIIPVYPQTSDLNQVGLSSKAIRYLTNLIFANLTEKLADFLPEEVRSQFGLMEIFPAIEKIHYPDDRQAIDICRKRLAFDELLTFQYLVFRRKERKRKIRKEHNFEEPGKLTEKFYSSLPFKLTRGQTEVISEIFSDLQSKQPMSRLLQGDVGCGKTVVAVVSAVYAAENKLQTAFMAPTEILAEQHFSNWQENLRNLGISTALVTSTTKDSEKREIAAKCAEGSIRVLFGTHALIYDYIEFSRLGLVIIDEQHRFGVEQRSKLYAKGDNPDLLLMTATPIPRTLALTLYGDLDISTISTMPPGRKPIRTVQRKSTSRDKVYEYVRDEVKKGGQAYIIYPLIERSDKMELRSVEDSFKELATDVFSDCRTAIVHGRVKSASREKILKQFKKGKIDILFATTVIEVGIDNPNASIMIIEHAERFGLSQLHQLRGRVGRGQKESIVVAIVYPTTSDISGKRLEYFVSTSDGFKISEADLDLRGPGELFGTRQSGLPEFRIANIARDQKLIEMSNKLLSRLFDTKNNFSKDNDYINIKNHLEKISQTKEIHLTGG